VTQIAERRQTELTNELAGTSSPAPLIHPNLAEAYHRKVAALHEAFSEPASRDEACDLIRSLIEVIRLVPEELRIEIKGLSSPAFLSCAGRRTKGSPALRPSENPSIEVPHGRRRRIARAVVRASGRSKPILYR
jgi:hypothetical protein